MPTNGVRWVQQPSLWPKAIADGGALLQKTSFRARRCAPAKTSAQSLTKTRIHSGKVTAF
jgi:hypothetical protein